MKKRALAFIQNHPRQSWKARELSRELKIPVAERRQFRMELKTLAREGLIYRLRGGRYTLTPTPQQQVRGILKMHYQGYGFVIPDQPGEADVFVPSRFMGHALPTDHVVVDVLKVDERGRREGRVIEVVRRGRSVWVGRLIKMGHQYCALNQDFAFDLPILIQKPQLKDNLLGQNVAVRLSEKSSIRDGLEGELVQVLGHPFEEKTEVQSILIRHQLEREFPADVILAANSLSEPDMRTELSHRVDLRQRPFITIDGLHACDFDDAVLVEKEGPCYRLYVSIADVAHYVTVDSALDREALRRGTSTYFSDFVIPMLPPRLSNELCSLNPGVDRLCLTCEMVLDGQGHLHQASYYESVIKSHRRGIYDDVQGFFDGDIRVEESYPPQVRESLKLQQELAQILLRQRGHRGSLDFDLPEAEIVYDHRGEIEAIVQAKRFFSHKLIEEFMIMANHAIGLLFQRLGVPILYRVHDRPESTKMSQFLELLHNLKIPCAEFQFDDPKEVSLFLRTIQDHPLEGLIHQVLLRSMKMALYTTQDRGHFGLNLASYAHFTSPIRRYPDLLVHRQLKALLKFVGHKQIVLRGSCQVPRGMKFIRQALEGLQARSTVQKIGQESSMRERESMEAEREMMDFKRTQFMRAHLGQDYLGTVRRVNSSGLFVQLEPHLVEGYLHVRDLQGDYYVYDATKMRFVGRRKRKVYSVGMVLKVRVKDIAVSSRMILLELM